VGRGIMFFWARSRGGATSLGVGRIRGGSPGWLVPRDPGLEDGIPLGFFHGRRSGSASGPKKYFYFSKLFGLAGVYT
jgi:hypothetical protein